jgi:hypothetical protein
MGGRLLEGSLASIAEPTAIGLGGLAAAVTVLIAISPIVKRERESGPCQIVDLSRSAHFGTIQVCPKDPLPLPGLSKRHYPR